MIPDNRDCWQDCCEELNYHLHSLWGMNMTRRDLKSLKKLSKWLSTWIDKVETFSEVSIVKQKDKPIEKTLDCLSVSYVYCLDIISEMLAIYQCEIEDTIVLIDAFETIQSFIPTIVFERDK